MEYYVFITNDCNLNCNYCSVLLDMKKSGIPKEPVYSVENLNKFIDSTQKKYSDNVADIVFFGGEPTLNYDFIEKIIMSQKLIETNTYNFRYMLHTNGLLLKDIPKNILDNIDSILLSINYEKIPRLQLNDSYFKAVIDSVQQIKKQKNIPIISRLTITEKTSLYSEIALVNSFFDGVYWQIENKYAFENYNDFYNSYKYDLNLVFNLWIHYLKKGILLRFIPIMAALEFFIDDKKPDAFCCGYNDSMLYIQTDGNCYICAEDMTTKKNLIGEISSEIEFDNFGLKDTICQNCEYLNICKGRCGRMHREFNREHINEYCKLNKLLFDMVKENINEILKYYKLYNLKTELDDFIYHYTEYTP